MKERNREYASSTSNPNYYYLLLLLLLFKETVYMAKKSWQNTIKNDLMAFCWGNIYIKKQLKTRKGDHYFNSNKVNIAMSLHLLVNYYLKRRIKKERIEKHLQM